MVQSINSTQKIEETDGLPMPKRIWAVVSVGFALCMSVLDINIVNIVLPTLSHDFGTSPAVTTWIINGYQLAIVISLLSFSFGYRPVLHHFIDLCLVRFVLDANRRPYFSGVQCLCHHQREYGTATLYLSEEPDWAGNGD